MEIPPFWHWNLAIEKTVKKNPLWNKSHHQFSYAARCFMPKIVIYQCNGPCGYRSRVADSRVQRLNHWAIKVPERPSRLRLAGSLHYSPLFEIRAPWLGPLSTKARSFHSQADPGYRCHQCNGPCGDRTRVARSRVQRLNHWAIKVPERPNRLRLAGSLHYSPLLKSEPPGSGHFQPRLPLTGEPGLPLPPV